MTKSVLKRSAMMLFVSLLTAGVMVSCGKESGPEGVAKNFLELTAKGEFGEAKKYCDEPTAQLLSMAEGLAQEKKEEMKDKKVTVEIISSEENEEGNTATVKYKQAEGDEDIAGAEEKTLTLKKIDGDWKVSIDKEGMNKENNAPAMDENMEGDADMDMDGEGEMEMEVEGDSI